MVSPVTSTSFALTSPGKIEYTENCQLTFHSQTHLSIVINIGRSVISKLFAATTIKMVCLAAMQIVIVIEIMHSLRFPIESTLLENDLFSGQ